MADLEVLDMKVVKLDVVGPDSVRKAVGVVCEATGGSLDILVNKAGIGKVWCLLREEVYYYFLSRYNQ